MQIICATDFSEPALAAADLAGAVARTLGDEVLLVHVSEPPPFIGLENPTRWETEREQTAERRLDAVAGRLRDRGTAVDAHLVAGSAVTQLRELGAGPDVRMLVLGTHGRKGAAHLFVGSVAEGVARSAPCPVLVTRGSQFPPGGFLGRARLQVMALMDGGPAAEAALGWVRALRELIPCDVTFVQSYWPGLAAELYGIEGERSDGGPVVEELLERELRRWIQVLPGTGEVRFRMRALHGHPAAELAIEAERTKPDLVVAGITPGRFAGARSSMTAHEILRACRLPVLCVPETLRPAAAATAIPVIRRVLVGTDLSAFANQVVPHACALLTRAGGTLAICHVYETLAHMQPISGIVPVPRSLDAQARAEVEARLASLVPPEAAALGITSQVAVVEAPNAADGLRREAAKLAADVVVVASHGRTGLTGALMGSVAIELAKQCLSPVLIIHPPKR